jgi:voltage-gated potassium channel
MKNKIIIYSFSNVAQHIAMLLQKKSYKVIIVEDDPILVQKARDNNFEVKDISLMEDDNIKEVGLANDDVRAFFCLGEDRNKNLFITLSVRKLNKDVKIISVTSTEQQDKVMLLAGADRVINPYEIGALRIFKLLHKPLILEVMDNILFSKTDIEVLELTIKKGSIFDGVYLDELKIINRQNVVILGIQDKELSDKFIFFSTGINHKIDEGDTLVVLGHKKDLEQFQEFVHSII